MKKGFLVFVLFILAFTGFSVAENIYDSIPIQIQVLSDAGVATTGTFTFKIDISNSVTCSPILYTNTSTLTTDSRGVVSYNLINVDLPFDEQYWFCYYRDGVLKATIKSARVPYAFNAKNISSSGINVNSNLNMGSYNVSADKIIISGNEICNSTACFNLQDLNSSTGSASTVSGVPAGMIAPFNLTECPTGWTLADGSSGTPDLRGIFIRGSGTNSILKYANGSYFSSVLGTYGNDSSQAHWHFLGNNIDHTQIGRTVSTDAGTTYSLAAGTTGTSDAIQYATEAIATGTNGNPRTGAETSPAYYSTIYCVKTTEDSATSNSIWGVTGNYISVQNTSKNVGIGTSSPSSKLHVGGNVNITGNLSLGAGQIFYNSSANKYYYYNTTEWVEIGSGASSSNYINPIVESGNNTNGSYIKFIDGTMMAWVNNYSFGSVAITSGSGSLFFSSNYYYAFPVAFISNPSVQIRELNPAGGSIVSLGGVGGQLGNTTHAKFSFSSSTSVTTLIVADIFVIGKWSETPYNTSTITVGGGIPAGAIVAYNRTSCPVGWVLADGGSGTPDLRGIFIRGSGTNSILKRADGNYFNATQGTYQNDSFQGHWHSLYRPPWFSIELVAGSSIFAEATTAYASTSSATDIRHPLTGGNGAVRYGNETSPAYYSTIYCVKMTEDTATSNTIWATSGNNVLLNNASNNLNVQNSKIRATRGATQTISANTVTIIQYNTEVYDTLGEYDNSTNYRFTATQAGYYSVSARIYFQNSSYGLGNGIALFIFKNNAQYSMLGSTLAQVAFTDNLGTYGTDVVYLSVGDYIDIRYYGKANTIFADSVYNYLSITRIP